MRARGGILLLLSACGTTPPQLQLEGPQQVTVDTLGPVQGPVATLSDGTAPADLTVSAAPGSVAMVAEGVVQAVGPGEAEVTVSWKEQSATWTLVVEPAITLWIAPPDQLQVGRAVPLPVEARIGDQNVDPGDLTWTSSAEGVATVDGAGIVTGVAPGMVYITAESGRSNAMVELKVVATQ